MDSRTEELQRSLDRLREETGIAADRFLKQYGDQVDEYRRTITTGLKEALSHLEQDVSATTANNPMCRQLITQAAEYIDWLQWSLWDIPFFAVALRPSLQQFGEAVAACGIVYLSIRIFDDVIDRHFWYKGKHPTLLSAASTVHPNSQGVEGLTILAGLLLCFEGFSILTDPAHAELNRMFQPVLRHVRRAVIGAVMEYSDPHVWDATYYDRLVDLKNVDYWRSLYAAIDPDFASPLYPFLARYYALAQNLNDVQDFSEDLIRGQPNLLTLYIPSANGNGQAACPPRDREPAKLAPPEVEEFLAGVFLELSDIAAGLPEPERLVAQLKLGESLDIAYRLGLFAPPALNVPAPEPQPPLGLHWYSGLQEIVERVGHDVLQHVPCAVCGSHERNFLFTKQEFAYHRCTECSHIYVSPRISTDLQLRMCQELDDEGPENTFLEVQKIYAAPICGLLRARAPGPRLLDLGFGQGYLMQMARAHGFEVYGADSSQAAIRRISPQFGMRVQQMVLGDGEIPWHSFDVVVMSHVVEHLPNPADVLKQVLGIMNPGGILYLAVPNMNSLQFQVFGKKWDVINPLVHFQYFTPNSLARLLRNCGFTNIGGIQPPRAPAALTPRWVELIQRLGGTSSGELAVLAHVSSR
jgi:2-polyprenyl-3-methyl-5-hydroxy-6-metoxy-1,4-benzoquinol methylase